MQVIASDRFRNQVNKIDNTNKENLDQKTLGWNGSIESTREIFGAISRGELSGGDIAKKVITRKIKIKNPKVLIKFGELGALLRE